MWAYSKLGSGGQDARINELVGVDDECRARDGGSTRHQGRGLGNRNSENAAHGGQRQRSRDGGDHAGGGEHRWDVKKSKSENDEEEKAD